MRRARVIRVDMLISYTSTAKAFIGARTPIEGKSHTSESINYFLRYLNLPSTNIPLPEHKIRTLPF